MLEPEVMDTRDEARDYNSMDRSAFNRQFVLEPGRVVDQSNLMLDVGAGTAQIAIELSRQHPVRDHRQRTTDRHRTFTSVRS